MKHVIIATVVAVVYLVSYVVACRLFPLTACPRCDGAGKHRSPSGKTWRKCSRCRGSGERPRFGVRAYRWWRRRR